MLACLLLLLAVSPRDTAASRIGGIVTDTSGVAVPSAQVRIDTLPWTRPARSGAYMLTTTPGAHVLEVRAVGFDPVEVPLEVMANMTMRVNVRLARAVVLAGVQVTAAAPGQSGADAASGFDARRARAVGGTFLDSAEVARRGTSRMTDLLRGLPGVALVPVTGPLGTTDDILVMRGKTTVRSDVCPIQFYLDGHPLPADDHIDRMVSPSMIAALEVYHGASDTPLQFRGPTARCGVIVIWTKH